MEEPVDSLGEFFVQLNLRLVLLLLVETLLLQVAIVHMGHLDVALDRDAAIFDPLVPQIVSVSRIGRHL